MLSTREQKRIYRHNRIRRKVVGTNAVPRLCIHRSLKNFQAYVINDEEDRVILGKSTLSKDLKASIKSGGNVAAAKALGEAIAKDAVAKGIKKVCFDRGGYLYHGRVKAFAEGAREGGLEF